MEYPTTMTANASSSSATSPAEPGAYPQGSRDGAYPGIDLLSTGRLAPVAAAVLEGKGRGLLAPLSYLEGGALPAPASPAPDRGALAAGLAEANQAYGHPRARELAEKLADPATRVVVTGQQPGLFGGPLYALSKLVAAARWAAHLEEQGQPAVAVFWVATEDHDFDEVASATFLAPDGLTTFGLGEDQSPLLPVGMRTLGPRVATILEELQEVLPGDRGQAWIETMGRWYRPDARIGEAFCRQMVHLLGERCPLMLDALLPSLKKAEAPWMRRLVEERSRLGDLQAAAHEQVEKAGLPLQVTPQPGASPLFLLRGAQRRRIEWRGEDRFTLRGGDGEEEPVSRLLEILEENPGIVSPGVLARPAIQDAVLGTSLLLLGPGEMSYLPQAAAAYRLLEIPAPSVILRPQVLLLEPRHRRWLDGLGLELDLLFGDSKELERWQAERSGVDPVGPVEEEVAAALDGLREPVLAVDKNLESPWQKTRDQVLKALGQLSDRVAAAVSRSKDVERQRLENLRETLQPEGKLQERLISTGHFPGKYGEGLVEALWNQMDLDPATLQTIDLR